MKATSRLSVTQKQSGFRSRLICVAPLELVPVLCRRNHMSSMLNMQTMSVSIFFVAVHMRQTHYEDVSSLLLGTDRSARKPGGCGWASPPASASSTGPVQLNGRRHTIAGRVCMDQFVVDLGPDAADAPGDAVELFGPASGIPVEEWAAAAGTINYELVTRIGGRVDRQHVDPTSTQEARP